MFLTNIFSKYATAANSPSMAQWLLTWTSCSGIAYKKKEH